MFRRTILSALTVLTATILVIGAPSVSFAQNNNNNNNNNNNKKHAPEIDLATGAAALALLAGGVLVIRGRRR